MSSLRLAADFELSAPVLAWGLFCGGSCDSATRGRPLLRVVALFASILSFVVFTAGKNRVQVSRHGLERETINYHMNDFGAFSSPSRSMA